MSVGIQVYNSFGMIQITDQYSNLRFVSKGTITIPSYSGYNAYNNRVALLSPFSHIIAFRCNSGWAGLSMYFKQSDTVRKQEFIGSSGAVIDYYAFANEPFTSGHHIEVYDGAGNIKFSDSHRALETLAMRSGKNTNYKEGYLIETVSHDSSVSSAVVVGASSSAWYANYAGTEAKQLNQVYSFSSGKVESIFRLTDLWGDGRAYAGFYNGFYHYMIIDVTGL